MDSKRDERINRREFVAVSMAGAGLPAAGGAAGWWASRSARKLWFAKAGSGVTRRSISAQSLLTTHFRKEE